MRAITVLHPVITVSDMDVALEFYRDLLGLEVSIDHVHDPILLEPLLGVRNANVRAVVLKCPDGTEVELVDFRYPRGKATVDKRFEDSGITFVTLIVEDLDAVVALLKNGGFETTGPITEYPLPTRVRVVYCFGPDRTALTLAEYLPRSG